MKRNNGGFSLVEIVVAMAILGLFAIATCTSLVLALRMNDKTESMLQAQLAVSSAVETLMAEGIDEDKVISDADNNKTYIIDMDGDAEDDFPGIKIALKSISSNPSDANAPALPYYEVTATSDDGNVSVTTHIRKAVAP